MAKRLTRRFSKLCWVKSGGAMNPSQQMMPSLAPPVKVMAPAPPTTCAITKVRSRQAINDEIMPKAPFFGLLLSEKPTRVNQDLRKTRPYQRAPSSHSATAAITIIVTRCLVRIIENRIAEYVTTCILESSTTGLGLGSHVQKPQGRGFPPANLTGVAANTMRHERKRSEE